MRIVAEQVTKAGTGQLKAGDSGTNARAYFDRVAKYIPAEIVAVYIAASGIALQAKSPGVLLFVLFAFCVVCTPLYVTRFTSTTREAWVNSAMAVVAFVVWAYATGGGLVQYLGWYDGPTASVVLMLFTLASGVVVPTSKQEPPIPGIISD